jgi:guanylate kinase
VTPRVVILSAPSGGGKTTIAKTLVARRSDVGLSVSATTRPPRAGERDGEAYHFVGRDEFQRRIDAGAFLEWAEYAGERYGTLRGEVDALRANGRHALLDIEVQGARQVRERLPAADVVTVFVLPPDPGTWLTRLGGRRSETPAALARRFATAVRELDEAVRYDHVVVNDSLDGAVRAVSTILDDPATPRRPPDWRERIMALRHAAVAAAGGAGGTE